MRQMLIGHLVWPLGQKGSVPSPCKEHESERERETLHEGPSPFHIFLQSLLHKALELYM
jgi:hypothetical protein